MKIDDAREEFIIAWGQMATDWGVNKTMGQVHGLLLVACRPYNCDEVMETLKISRGNAHTTIKALIDWGLVHKHTMVGERKDYFVAEKDVWKIFTNILVRRKQKELDPMIQLLDKVSGVKSQCPQSEEFIKMTNDLKSFSQKTDRILATLLSSKSNILLSNALRMMR